MSEENQDIDLPPAKKQKLDSEDHEEGERVDSPPLQEETRDKDSAEQTSLGAPNEDKYTNFVTAEELEKLREFKVLDEVKSNDEDSNDDSDSTDGKSEGIPEDEIEKMLEEDLPDGFKGAPKPKEKTYVTRQKIVLEEKVVDQFEVLPLDWMMVPHYSGMPVYMHRATRVCTLSKPYFLGHGNTRRHEIPISAIPCYAYRRALEEEEKQKEIDRRIAEQIRTGSWRKNYNAANNNQNANKSTDNNNANSQNNPETNNASNEGVVEIDKGNNENINSANKNTNCNGNNNVIGVGGTAGNGNGNNAIDAESIVNNSNENNNAMNVEDIVENGNGNNNVINIENGDENNVTNVENNENVPITSTGNNKEGDKGEIDLNTQESTDKNNTENSQSNDTQGKCPFNHGDGTKAEKSEVEIPLNIQPVVLPGGIVMPPPKVETVNTSWKSQHLTPEQVNNYCKKLFKFKTVNIMLFERWADRRKYTKARKALQYPTLPEGTKLITIPANPNATSENGGSKVMKRDWVMNMDGRSYLSVFHEYVRRALQKQPVYEFKQLENAATPYQATVYIGGMQYGVGHGSSKRQAKSAAARASVHILIPEMKDELDAHMGHTAAAKPPNEPDFTFFDYVGIEDPRIAEFCAAACEPSPHAILRTCLLRNFGAGDWHIHTEMKKLEYQKIELTMKVGKHSATVVCKNKKTAKQRASQAILQALHPLVRSWGSLLRLYGLRSVKSCKEKKIEEQEITLLQDKARHNEPNYAVLEKLRDEMRKLRERDEAVVPIGTLLLTDDLPTHSASNLNNIDL